jgi:hypothetical protein
MTPLHLTELEAQLAQPDGAARKQACLQRLDTMAWRLRQQVRAGVPRDEFPALEALIEAVQSAQQVLTDWPVPAQNLTSL